MIKFAQSTKELNLVGRLWMPQVYYLVTWWLLVLSLIRVMTERVPNKCLNAVNLINLRLKPLQHAECFGAGSAGGRRSSPLQQMDDCAACTVTAIPRCDALSLVLEGLLSGESWFITACGPAPVPEEGYAWPGQGKRRLGPVEGRRAFRHVHHPSPVVERIGGEPPVGAAVEVDGGLAAWHCDPAFETLVHGEICQHHSQGLGVSVELPVPAWEVILVCTPPLLRSLATLNGKLLTARMNTWLGGKTRRR
jgi:hypothetical protein